MTSTTRDRRHFAPRPTQGPSRGNVSRHSADVERKNRVRGDPRTSLDLRFHSAAGAVSWLNTPAHFDACPSCTDLAAGGPGWNPQLSRGVLEACAESLWLSRCFSPRVR